jgi:hypothetical protein
VTGEWFRFTAADKAVFNARSRAVLAAHEKYDGVARKWKMVPTSKLLSAKMPRRDWLTYLLRSKAFVGAAHLGLPKAIGS